MPTYDYLCENGHRFEHSQRITEDALETCVVCEAPVRRMLHAPAIHFKGSGFYSTDYGRGKRGPNGQESSKSESSNGSGGESSGGGSDSSGGGDKAKTPAGDSKPAANTSSSD
jgi:putative FmdB family regulatory protein